MKKIRDLVIDEQFEQFVLIKSADVRIAKNGKKFIAFTFQDTSGTIDGKYWDASEEEINKFTAGTVVFLNGKREVYQGNPQVKILHMRLTRVDEPGEPSLYMERAPLKKEEMEEEINQLLFEITNAHWNRIVRYLLNKYQKQFFEFPAAKRNHHAFASGLAYHTLTMLHLGKSIADEYPELNRALLYAGIILHDLGKVIELSGPMSTEYTLAGNLIGHLVLIDEEITKACLALKISEADEDVLVLRHGFSTPWLIRIWLTCTSKNNGSRNITSNRQYRCFDADDVDFDSSNRTRKIHRSDFRYGQPKFLCTKRFIAKIYFFHSKQKSET